MKIKSIKHKDNIALSIFIIMLCFFNVTLLTGNILGFTINGSNVSTASALTYSNTTDLSFTFNPTLSISLSSNTINIDNLVPGQVADSDPITVSVSSNTPYGYSLYASVGSSDTTSTYYNTSDLIHEDTTLDTLSSSPSFTSIATNANLTNLIEDNTWGYSYKSTAEGSTWSTYNGLPLYSTVDDNTSTENPAKLIDTKDPADNKSINFKLAAKASSTQASGTYNNVINFYAVGKVKPLPLLYDEVAKMNKGTQSATDLQATITAPTTTDPATDTSNSGVYKYDATTFGAASDADSSYAIYYYRGILEPEEDNGSFGSDGKATTYPNYVKLANNTCWRIVRTTGSGGVKMIYNGIWQGTAESGTCANNNTNAQLTTSPFNNDSATVAGKSYTGLRYQNMHAIGYTYSNVAAETTSATALSTLLGATGNDTTTNTKSSIIKKYIEDWYSTNMVNASSSSYTSILEESAGYCNDRSVYNVNSYAASTVLPDSTTVIPYGTKNMTAYYFGAFTRNNDAAQTPSLTCPRGIVDTYSTTTTSGGNGQLTHPIALLTADEMSFAGSGSSTATNGSSYSTKSYLRSGNSFWLLSLYIRNSRGYANGYILSSGGYLSNDYVNTSYGVRPAISLKPGTIVASGTGIATDPWIINE